MRSFFFFCANFSKCYWHAQKSYNIQYHNIIQGWPALSYSVTASVGTVILWQQQQQISDPGFCSHESWQVLPAWTWVQNSLGQVSKERWHRGICNTGGTGQASRSMTAWAAGGQRAKQVTARWQERHPAPAPQLAVLLMNISLTCFIRDVPARCQSDK